MPTRGTETRSQGFGAAAKTVAEHASAIVRLELELATMELKRKIIALGLGIALAIGAALMLLFMLGFALAAVAAAFATFLATWLALLITAGILFALAGLLGTLAIGRIRRGTPPVPQQAIREAKLTTNALKSDGTGA
jgi:Putative Actinobacterial Holin-X, holin superfamily III